MLSMRVVALKLVAILERLKPSATEMAAGTLGKWEREVQRAQRTPSPLLDDLVGDICTALSHLVSLQTHLLFKDIIVVYYIFRW